MCKFYIIALVGKIIEWLDNMHGVTVKIVRIYFHIKSQRDAPVSKIYFGMTLYMFRTVFPSIIRSSRLYIQQPNRYCCLLASKQTTLFDKCPVAVCTVLNSWWWTERPSETCRVSFQNKFEKLVHLAGFTIEIILRCTAPWTLSRHITSSNIHFYSKTN